MIKSAILASSMIIAVPAFAGDVTAFNNIQDAPVSSSQDAQTTQSQTPMTEVAPTQAADAAPTQAPAAPTGTQVGQAVDRDWATYDLDSNKQLNVVEFTTWVSALRSASEPNFKAGTPETDSWSKQAFASADTDKSASLSRDELVRFLTPKAS